MTRYFYEHRSEKIFPYQSFEAARPQRRNPIYQRQAAAGAVFGTGFGGEHATWFAPEGTEARDGLTYRQPNWWQAVADEGRRVRDAVGLFDFSDMAKFEVTGANAESWLNRVMTNRMPRPGRMCLSAMLSEKGRMLGNFTISNLGDRFLVIGSYAMQLAFMRHFSRYLPSEEVSLRNVSDKLAGLHIAGPNAQALIGKLAEHEMDSAHFRFLDAADMSIAGIAGRYDHPGILYRRDGI